MEINDIDITEDPLRELSMVSVEVYGKTLMQHEISNGMLKTIYYIVDKETNRTALSKRKIKFCH